jgi:hypothetical protein
MTLVEAREVLDNSEKHSKGIVERAREIVQESLKSKLAKAKEDLIQKQTGRMGRMDAQQAKSQKTQMAYGGTAMGKKHFYVAGGSVTLNPGLKALRKSSPEAFAKITKGKTVKMGD